ncbi:Rieske 2Fe-2S domain-containing protein [Siccirubricoccus sp. KC 17139]|uniref:Rieske 2Fe-2S domain-containing protein n=1 Tax=Siccirubricoccus soli TaxID=2899147 RepID=A0ABT1DB50_9PROT|nr:Rieske 2Fe-2S domain-containing protein [Siccirubricoccus soli]MCO6418200.1 Rieske 2Fe-2S domain-containing protein [Siccirubricoccus soli]MCP2684335.1 Rieske 2Fe-2S domain-containing protein [Siccirubricoccus soli]
MAEDETARRVLCRLEEIPDNAARGFPAAPGGFTGLFAVRRGEKVHVYVNSCPHIGLPLEPLPDRFLDTRKQVIICSAHGARFRIEDGVCLTGPCIGEALEAVPVEIQDGVVTVPADAGL